MFEAGTRRYASGSLAGVARKTVETVETWASTTNAILRLREHLITEQVSFWW